MWQGFFRRNRIQALRFCAGVSLCVASGEIIHAADFNVSTIATLNPTGAAYINAYGTLNNLLIFEANNGQADELFSTDGVVSHQLDIAGQLAPNPEPLEMPTLPFGVTRSSPFKGALYFVADGTAGRTLYKTDAFVATPVLSGVSGLVDIDVYRPPYGSASDDFLYVNRTVGTDEGLYRTDGNSASLVTTTFSGSTDFFYELNGQAILYSSNSSGGAFFRESAAAQNPIAFGDQITFPSNLTVAQNGLYFSGVTSAGPQLFRTDGSTITQISPNGMENFNSLFLVGGTLYLKAQTISGYQQVYRTDGTQLVPVNLGSPDQSQTRFIAGINDALYLFEYSRRRISLLQGNSMVDIDLGAKPDVSNFSLKGMLGNTLLLDLHVAKLGVTGSASEGLFMIAGGTATFVDINGGQSYSPSSVTTLGSDIYFTAFGAHGNELFRVRNGQVSEFDINPSGNSSPSNLTVLDDVLYFSATNPIGPELYAINGGAPQQITIPPSEGAFSSIVGSINGKLLISLVGPGGSSRIAAVQAIPEPSIPFLLLIGCPGILGAVRSRGPRK
jgi:hypothetical protein